MRKKWLILAFLLMLPSVIAQRYGYNSGYSYGGYGGFFGGGIPGLDAAYTGYPGVIDFLVFFMIFSGVARMVFNKMFPNEPATKAVYVGLGLALSLGGVYSG